jgi:modulator of FtsH protease
LAAYNAPEWNDLFIAAAGASAALAGLVFVAVSINVERILKGEGLPARAQMTVLLLITVLLVLIAAGTLPFIVGAASLLAETGGGLYWTVGGIVFAIVGGVLNAWVLLVEILR